MASPALCVTPGDASPHGPKALNLYISDLQRVLASAPTQFMTRGSSHELLLTETICYTTLTWILLLDKQSAFDSVLKEHILSEPSLLLTTTQTRAWST